MKLSVALALFGAVLFVADARHFHHMMRQGPLCQSPAEIAELAAAAAGIDAIPDIADIDAADLPACIPLPLLAAAISQNFEGPGSGPLCIPTAPIQAVATAAGFEVPEDAPECVPLPILAAAVAINQNADDATIDGLAGGDGCVSTDLIAAAAAENGVTIDVEPENVPDCVPLPLLAVAAAVSQNAGEGAGPGPFCIPTENIAAAAAANGVDLPAIPESDRPECVPLPLLVAYFISQNAPSVKQLPVPVIAALGSAANGRNEVVAGIQAQIQNALSGQSFTEEQMGAIAGAIEDAVASTQIMRQGPPRPFCVPTSEIAAAVADAGLSFPDVHGADFPECIPAPLVMAAAMIYQNADAADAEDPDVCVTPSEVAAAAAENGADTSNFDAANYPECVPLPLLAIVSTFAQGDGPGPLLSAIQDAANGDGNRLVARLAAHKAIKKAHTRLSDPQIVAALNTLNDQSGGELANVIQNLVKSGKIMRQGQNAPVITALNDASGGQLAAALQNAAREGQNIPDFLPALDDASGGQLAAAIQEAVNAQKMNHLKAFARRLRFKH